MEPLFSVTEFGPDAVVPALMMALYWRWIAT
jgi:hypothetical protein